MRRASLLIFVLGVFEPLLGGCNSSKKPKANQTIGGPTTTQAATPPDGALGVSFRKDVAPVLARTCASTEGCHGEHRTKIVELDLREGQSFASLVRVASELREGQQRVVPGQPDASFLINKLKGKLQDNEGRAMPLDPATGTARHPSPVVEFVDRMLIPWIAAGATNQ